MPAPSTSTIRSSEAICDTPRPCTAASAVSRSATSTTTTAGSTAISGASADRNTATSSAITKMMENHWTWPPVLPEVALVSTRVATVPAVCTARPPGGPAARMASRTPATSVACWVAARPPDWASAASTVSWLGLPVGRLAGVPHRHDPGHPGQRARQPRGERPVRRGKRPGRYGPPPP